MPKTLDLTAEITTATLTAFLHCIPRHRVAVDKDDPRPASCDHSDEILYMSYLGMEYALIDMECSAQRILRVLRSGDHQDERSFASLLVLGETMPTVVRWGAGALSMHFLH